VNKFLSSNNSPTASSSWKIGSILGLWIVSLLISQSLDAGLQKNSLGVKWKWEWEYQGMNEFQHWNKKPSNMPQETHRLQWITFVLLIEGQLSGLLM
jgi:hypothetical protein